MKAMVTTQVVMPAQAGIQTHSETDWIPAFAGLRHAVVASASQAGMTESE